MGDGELPQFDRITVSALIIRCDVYVGALSVIDNCILENMTRNGLC